MKKTANLLLSLIFLLILIILPNTAQATIPSYCGGQSSASGSCNWEAQCIEPGPNYEIAWSATTSCPWGQVYLELYEASSYFRNELRICDIGGSSVWCATSYKYYYLCAQARQVYYRESPYWAAVSCDLSGCYGLTLLGSASSQTDFAGAVTYDAPRAGVPAVQFVCWDEVGSGPYDYYSAGYDPSPNVYLVNCVDNSDCLTGYYCDKSGNWDTWQCKLSLPTPTPTPLPTPVSTPVSTPTPTPEPSRRITEEQPPSDIFKPEGLDIGAIFGFGNILSLGAGTFKLVPAIFSIASILVILYFLYGAFKYLKAGGDKEEVAQARAIIIHAIIGFFLLMLAFIVLQFILSGLFGLTDFQVIP